MEKGIFFLVAVFLALTVGSVLIVRSPAAMQKMNDAFDFAGQVVRAVFDFLFRDFMPKEEAPPKTIGESVQRTTEKGIILVALGLIILMVIYIPVNWIAGRKRP